MLNAIEVRTRRIVPGKTLLFIDEIQGYPRAITALRYFYEQLPELHVVAAGSMLEFAFGQISVPVGRIQYLHLQPMTFYEFLLATGKENLLSIYNGRLAEQFVAQEFLAWHSERLYYWSRAARSANAEVDFLAVRDNKIYPVEVKVRTGGTAQKPASMP